MARPLRIEFSGALHHVTSRGNERRAIFRSDRDRLAFLRFLGETASRFGWSITAWVLMTNHFHLVIQTPEPNLSRGMQWLNGRYAAWFNAKHRRSGHLFQGRFKGRLIDGETYWGRVLRYVALNPVRAGLAERPEDYRWSSYRATAGLENPPEWFDLAAALRQFGTGEEALRNYRDFVDDKIGREDRLWDQLIGGMYLGSESWVKSLRRFVDAEPRSTDHPVKERAVGRPSMSEIVDAVERAGGLTAEKIRSRHDNGLRALIAWVGWHEGLVTLRTIAASLRLRSEGYVSNMIRRFEGRLGIDTDLLTRLDATLAILRT